jgi:hypothetical protein
MIDKSALMDEHVRQASGDFPLVMVVSRTLKRGAVGLLSYNGHEERRQQLPTSYRVVDVRTTVTDAIDVFVEGVQTPEQAAAQVVGHRVVRSGAKKDLVARVYWQPLGKPLNMVRMYKPAHE